MSPQIKILMERLAPLKINAALCSSIAADCRGKGKVSAAVQLEAQHFGMQACIAVVERWIDEQDEAEKTISRTKQTPRKKKD